jgi:very-short-patch-repair endonuclease
MKLSEETKLKISVAQKGRIPWNKGLTKKTDIRVIKNAENVSKALTGKKQSLERIVHRIQKRKENGNNYLSDETKIKISKAHIGKKLSNEHKENISKANKGKLRSEEFKKNLSTYRKGKPLSSETRLKISKIHSGHSTRGRGWKHSNETKNKMRNIRTIKNIESGKWCSIGKNETQLLNEQEIKDNCKIIRQFVINKLGYTADGYCKETNTIYEVYESAHEKRVFQDLKRENEICNLLNCDFIIIWDR